MPAGDAPSSTADGWSMASSTAIARASSGGISCGMSSGPGRRYGNVTVATAPMARGTRSWRTGGQRNDKAMLTTVLDDIYVPRTGPGQPRSRPDAVLADRVYDIGKTQQGLRRRAINAVIAQERNYIAHARVEVVVVTVVPPWRNSLQGPQRGRAAIRVARAVAGPGHKIRQICGCL